MKEEVVSVRTNLEVVSEESFQRRLQGMSQTMQADRCQDCLKERARQQRNKKGRRSHRQLRSKHNSPIVIRLQDTIKVSVKGRGKIKAIEMDSSESSSDDNSGDSLKLNMQSLPTNQLNACSVLEHLCSDQSGSSSGDISALISVIEKVHSKERVDNSANYDNLQEFVYTSKEKGKGPLNNMRYRGRPHRSQGSPHRKRRGFDLFQDASNVELICNDLSSKLSHKDSFDESENASTISSSDSHQDSEASSSDSLHEELCAEELEQITQYASGFPITRYDCSPQECPECLSWWPNYWGYPGYFPERAQDSLSWCENPHCDDCKSANTSTDEDTSQKPSSKFKVVSVAPGKVDVFIGSDLDDEKTHKQKCPSFLNDGHTVFVDLGETDVDLDVFYHSETGSHVHGNSPDWMYGNTSNFVYYPIMMPYYLMPAYMLAAAMPFMPIPKPICVPRNTQCLSSQRLCMVPAHEVKNCKLSLYQFQYIYSRNAIQ